MSQVRALFRLLTSSLVGSLVFTLSSSALAAVPTVTLTASPAFLTSGATSKLTWSSTGATSCTASGAWSGTKATSGTQTTAPLTTNVSYRLTCTGPDGSKTATAFINIKPTLTLSAAPTSVVSGGTTKLTWFTTRATSCTASGAWTGTKATSGTQTTSALTTSANYTLTCKGSGGSISRTVAVTVGQAAAALTFTATPQSVATNGTATLSWAGTGVSSCAASGAWTGTKGTSGTQTTGALTANKSYTLTCSGAGGSVAKTTTVTLAAAAAPTATLTASPVSVQSGAASQLTWSTTNATSCAASGSWSGAKGTSGTQSTGALTANSSFTLTCAGAAGNVAKTATVSVTAGAPSVTLSANPKGVARNGTATLTWTGTNVTTCNASAGWTGTKTTTGSQSVGPLTQDASYSLNCSGAGGNAVAMTTVALREATLSWQAPTKNTNGSTATLSGYKIYYGTAPRTYTQTVSVSGAATLQRTIVLAPGTWYFAMTAVDTQGAESAKTGEVSKLVQ